MENKEDKVDFEFDMQINPDQLDVEWLMQPRLMVKYGRHKAQAAANLDRIKQRVDVTRAEIQGKVRANPAAYGIDKITESAIQAAVDRHPEFLKVNEERIAASYELDILSTALRAFEHRREALENLVRLFAAQYFAGPTVPHNISKDFSQAMEQRGHVNVMAEIKATLERAPLPTPPSSAMRPPAANRSPMPASRPAAPAAAPLAPPRRMAAPPVASRPSLQRPQEARRG